MICVSRTADWRGELAAACQRAVAEPRSPAVAACVLGLIAVAETFAQPAGLGSVFGLTISIRFAAVLLALAGTLPVALVTVQPAPAAWTISTASVLSLAAFQTLTIAGLVALLVVIYRLSRIGSQLMAAALVTPFVLLAVVLPARGQTISSVEFTVLAASLTPAAAWAGGTRRASAEAAEHGAARQAIAGTLLEHTARGERARISRELHDVVAHHISMIAVQAETARLTTPEMPAAGAQRLSAIGDTARAALTEMRRLLGVLREDITAEIPDRQPQPGLQQLNELIDEVREATGTSIRLIAHGWLAPFDPGVELAAYRIIQEALTNARRHAPGAAVDVELIYSDEALWLRVRDNGPGPPPGNAIGSHGLVGMRERAAAVGGELRTGTAIGGGFVVEAVLPAKVEATR
jgi:signal transduction histidine kinase